MYNWRGREMGCDGLMYTHICAYMHVEREREREREREMGRGRGREMR